VAVVCSACLLQLVEEPPEEVMGKKFFMLCDHETKIVLSLLVVDVAIACGAYVLQLLKEGSAEVLLRFVCGSCM